MPTKHSRVAAPRAHTALIFADPTAAFTGRTGSPDQSPTTGVQLVRLGSEIGYGGCVVTTVLVGDRAGSATGADS